MNVPRFRLRENEYINEAVIAAARANHFVLGPEVAEFESRLAQLFRYRHCVTTVNGFAALHLAIEATNVGHKELIVPAASTCFAVLNSVHAARSPPRFVDLGRDARIDVAAVANVEDLPGTVVLTPSHFGIPSPVKDLQALGCVVIEDAAQAFHTAVYAQQQADVMVLSFYPSKHVNAIDGGALLTNDDVYAERARDRLYYDTQRRPDGIVRYNYRMPALHAAAGIAAIEGVSSHSEAVKKIRQSYAGITNRYHFVHLLGDNDKYSDFVLTRMVLVFDEAQLASRFLTRMIARGIGCAKELLPLVDDHVLRNRFPCANKFIQRSVSIPYYPALAAEEVDWVVRILNETLAELSE